MARLARLALPLQLHYVGQKGHNGQPVFLDGADFAAFIEILRVESFGAALSVHGFALQPNACHLLVTPQERQALPRLMQAIGRRYSPYFNRRYGRTGSPWDGRYKTTVLEAERYWLDALVWLAGIGNETHQQSGVPRHSVDSAPHYLGQYSERCLTPATQWWTLGNTPFAREQAFAEKIQAGLSAVDSKALSLGLGTEWVMGSDAFIGMLSATANRRVTKRSPGRPKKLD
jgi:putative transposase